MYLFNYLVYQTDNIILKKSEKLFPLELVFATFIKGFIVKQAATAREFTIEVVILVAAAQVRKADY